MLLGIIGKQNVRSLLCSFTKYNSVIGSFQFSTLINEKKLYELRTYSIKPEFLKEFLHLTSQEFYLRTSQSKLIGYWTSELGGLNEVVHLWEYDNLEHRATVRLNLAGNAEWINKYFSKILPWMTAQQNSVLSVIPGIEFQDVVNKGIYQLQIGNANSSPVDSLKGSGLLNNNPDSLLIGAFQTVHGQLNQIALLWQHKTLTAATDLVHQQLNAGSWNYINGYSKILLPHKVSPLQ